MALSRLFFTLVVFVGLSAAGGADDGDAKPFSVSDTLMADHAQALEKALAGDKRLLVIIGANWCHDTMAFLRKIDDGSVAPLIEAGFEKWLVDVGYFDSQWEDLLQHYDLPTIYGTPTVLVVDPASDVILNPMSMHRWRDAYKEDVDDIRVWVGDVAAPEYTEAPDWLSPKHNWQEKALDRIDAFELQQGNRIRTAYKTMRAVLDDNAADSDRKATMKRWMILADMRAALAVALPAARQAVMDGTASDIEAVITGLPHHKLFDGI